MIGTLLDVFWSCTKIGLLAFGGGNAAIPLLESEAVPRWISEQGFEELVGINFAFPGISVLTIAAYSLLVQYRDHRLVRRAALWPCNMPRQRCWPAAL